MLSLTVSQNSGEPLCDQIVGGIKRQIDDRHLRPGTKLPSIRNFAETYHSRRFVRVRATSGYPLELTVKANRQALGPSASTDTPANDGISDPGRAFIGTNAVMCSGCDVEARHP
jgi:DNA-binding transcriptional MocR family regulator